MTISVKCPHCSYAYDLKDELSGTKIRCPQCNEIFTATPTADRGSKAAAADLPEIDNAGMMDDNLEFQTKRPGTTAGVTRKKKTPRSKK